MSSKISSFRQDSFKIVTLKVFCKHYEIHVALRRRLPSPFPRNPKKNDLASNFCEAAS